MASDLDDLLKSIRDEAKKESAIVPVADKGNRGEELVDEEIDERILNLLGLDDVFDIDYATYKTLLRERMAAGRMSDSSIPTEEIEILTDEFKRVKRNTGRFKVKKKKIKAQDIQKSSALGKLKGVTQAPQKLLPPAKEEPEKSPIDDIIASLNNIIDLLKSQNTLIKDTAEAQRKKSEKDRRAKLEAGLEKGFEKTMKGAMKMVAPVKSILQRIIEFIMGIIIGRFIIKLIDWFSDKDNQDKLKAIGQFLSDHWPKFAAAFLLFGTGLGGMVRSLMGLLIRGGVALVRAAAGLAAKAGLGKAGGVARFLGGSKGKLLTGALTTAATIGTGMFLSNKIEDTFKPSGESTEPNQNFNGGGLALKLPGFAGGGMFDSIFGMLGGLSKNIKGGLGTLGGFVSGEKGVDKVPAMLSDGEFVMSRGAVNKYGVGTLEAMNASGGGTNRPTVVQNVIKAAGGGLIGQPRKMKGDSEPPPPEKEGGAPKSSSSFNLNVGGSGGGSKGSKTTNIKLGGASLKNNFISANPTLNPKLNVSGGKNTYASFGGNSLSVFSPNINSAMFGGGNNMIFGVNNVLPMMMMVANNMQQSSKSTMGTQGSMQSIPQLKPNKAKVSIPGAPSRPPVIVQPPVMMSTSGSNGYGSNGPVQVDQLPTFNASFSSRDKSRNSKILGIF